MAEDFIIVKEDPINTIIKEDQVIIIKNTE